MYLEILRKSMIAYYFIINSNNTINAIGADSIGNALANLT